jgi:hypothetical protein
MNSTRWTHVLFALTVGVVCLALAVSMSAQVKTESSTSSGPSTSTTKVVRGTIVYLSGNDMVLKMDDGTLRHFNNIPDSAKAIVDGKEIGIKDAKVGMTLEKTVTTVSTPKTITTVKSVSGKVWHITPPNSVILTLEDGTNQEFKIPKGQKFNVDGQTVDAWGLKKGMNVSATKIEEVPITDVAVNQQITGQMPPPPPPPPDQPILMAVVVPPPAPAPAETPAPALPKTGSELPLIGLLGFLSVAASLGMKGIRTLL